MTTRKHTIKVGKTEIVHSWSNQITFVDVEGKDRQIDDSATGHVMKMIDAIQIEFGQGAVLEEEALPPGADALGVHVLVEHGFDVRAFAMFGPPVRGRGVLGTVAHEPSFRGRRRRLLTAA